MNQILNPDNIPSGFRIIQKPPELQIEYRSKPNGCVIVLILPLAVLSLMYAVLSLGYVVVGFILLSEAINDIPNLGLLRSVQNWLHSLNWWDLLGCISASLLFGVIAHYLMWKSFGVTNFLASRNRLIIDRNLFGMHSTKNIASIHVKYFERVNTGGEGKIDMDPGPNWGLRLITNQKSKIFAKKVISYELIALGASVESSDWLGRMLADFYQVEFRQGR